MSGSFWAPQVWIGGGIVEDVRITTTTAGTIDRVEAGVVALPGDTVFDGVVLPAGVNAHSHAFHRLLRGRTHGEGGSFWTWRELMYREAGRLEPDSYERVATAVFSEMVVAGWASVAEFHYVHHRVDGTPYDEPHAMERALARAAVAAGIRLSLLDTCYLAGGFDEPLAERQTRFGDGSVEGWLERSASLREVFAAEFDSSVVTVGAALHSVRAVPVSALRVVAARLDPDIALHMHVSEQPAENADCVRATGRTPVELLHDNGLLSPRFSAVHATHLSARDIALLGGAGATVVVCPTTEADLGDGIGPARELRDAGATVALGTDQHAVVDPLLEARALEHGERLRSGSRGRFTPGELVHAVSAGGSASVGRESGVIAAGAPCDLIEIDPRSTRTAGSAPDQLVMSATSSDVRTVVVGGRVLARNGRHVGLGDPGDALRRVMEEAA